MKNMRFMIGAASFILLVCGGVVAWKSLETTDRAPQSAPARMVKLLRVSGGVGDATIVYPGRLEAREYADLFFRVSGPVIENKLELGMAVRKGDLLMRIDPRDYEREVARLTHELEVMRAKHIYLEQECERMTRLLQSNATSRAIYEAALSARDASSAEIKGRETMLQIAGDRLADTRLEAPFDGRITRLDIKQFEMAKANEVVLSLQNLETLDVVVNVPEGNIPDGKKLGEGGFLGREFPVRFPGRNLELPATLTEFSPVASRENGTYELRLALHQPEQLTVFPGMTVEVRDLPGRGSAGEGMTKIPFAAVFRKGERSIVWQYEADSGKLSELELADLRPDGEYMLTSSIPAGTLIVAAGGSWVTGGHAVSVLNPEVLHEHR